MMANSDSSRNQSKPTSKEVSRIGAQMSTRPETENAGRLLEILGLFLKKNGLRSIILLQKKKMQIL